MEGRKWLKQKIADTGRSKGWIIVQVGITYKTLRSYLRGETSPCIDPHQWMSFADTVNTSLDDFVASFETDKVSSSRLPPMNADQCINIARKLNMSVEDLLRRLTDSD